MKDGLYYKQLQLSGLKLVCSCRLIDRETVLHMLTALGVNEAEQWLCPELESWDSELPDSSDIWRSLHDRADCWLETWTAEYKVTKMGFILKFTSFC